MRHFIVARPDPFRPRGADMSKRAAVSLYDCVGQIYNRRGFTILRFEAPRLTLRYSADAAAATE
jgi:hypothetical protein